ncbi:bifunctional 4-hydroxy-2-oxoglutarate aldolase/2-dehydro-3-deoxy-phosphogluconate aldolase [Kineococcus sp. SYSU DK001]|uniref:bifunctional 4-hydroxy-2-oxoglutarate aldolase/2-dehydro-3-deoxy-phosphogluconate aldolase n=1 Tax=Kineococcus sp. SYSU DK001 TaxID=3383122 RepID=UPI003D7E345B
MLETLFTDRVVCVVRAPVVPDPVALCEALAAGGIRTVELTWTTPGALDLLRSAADAVAPGTTLGIGTVLTADDARAAIDAGARFLVTPGLRPAVAEVARAAGIPFLQGALTPTEVLQAHETGATAVKVFPASAFGPAYLRDLHGPYPDLPLVPSGGITARNAAEFLSAGAAAVTAGTGVVPPDVVAAGDWAQITARATEFTGGL